MSRKSKELQLTLLMEKLAADSNKSPTVQNAQRVLPMLRTLASDLHEQNAQVLANMVNQATEYVSSVLEFLREPDRTPTEKIMHGTRELRRYALDNGHTVSVVRDTAHPRDLWEFAVLDAAGKPIENTVRSKIGVDKVNSYIDQVEGWPELKKPTTH